MADTSTALQSTTNYMIAHCSPKFKSINGSGTGIQRVDQRGNTGKTWYVCTWKNPNQAAIAAIQCITGGKNSHIFYSQKTRRQIFSNGMATTKTTHADCVSFVEQASRVATGKKNLKYPGAWSASLNAGISKTLKNTGLFQDFRIYKKGMTLYTGDLMWRAGSGYHGHIIMVVAGKTRTTTVDISEIQKLALQGGGDGSESTSFDQVYDMAAGVETMISSDNYKWLDEFEKEDEEEPTESISDILLRATERAKQSANAIMEEHTASDLLEAMSKAIAEASKVVLQRRGLQTVLSQLSSADTLVEAPFVELDFAGNVIGVYQGTTDKYPNLIQSMSVKKVNGEINQYTFNLVYQIRAGEDPQLVDKLISKVRFGGELKVRYGDCTSGKIFRDSKLVITNVKQNRSYTASRISYTIEATSACKYVGTYTTNFSSRNAQPSKVITDLLYNSGEVSVLLQNAFPGMKDKNKVMSKGLIPTDDMEMEIRSAQNIDSISYINALVGSMQSRTNTKESAYFITYNEDENNEMGGAYFKISKVTKDAKINSSSIYSVTVGYPDVPVYDFSVNTNNSWSILESNAYVEEYVYTMESTGEVGKRYSKTLTKASERQTAIDQNWWNFVTTYPITATLTVRGLTIPVMLCDFVNIDVVFYGQKHMTSGKYMITGQQDTLGPDGFKTTLTLVRTSD